MNFIKRHIYGIGATTAFVVAAITGYGSLAHANPYQFVQTTQLATATTSPAYLTSSGQATTTTFDAYAQGTPKAIDKGIFLIQDAASSTSSVLNVAFQYSNDNIDWYYDNTAPATTTVMDISANNAYKWTAAGTATSSKALPVSFPTRYIRAVLTESGAAAAIWWQFVPQRQSN